MQRQPLCDILKTGVYYIFVMYDFELYFSIFLWLNLCTAFATHTLLIFYIIYVLSLEIYRAIHFRQPCDRFYFSFITWIIIWFFNFLFKSINLYIFSLILFKMYVLLSFSITFTIQGLMEHMKTELKSLLKKLGLKGINTSIQKRLL